MPTSSARLRLFLLISCGLIGTAPALAQQAPAQPDDTADIIVTASTLDLFGKADTSSEGVVTRQELDLRPIYRVGQILETVPGLTVTAHSGEGKANQYLLRGFNLDHGTDLATSIDGMPVNMRTHAHGQGYTDVNFLIPELAGSLAFTKGPYFAGQGDFGSVGTIHMDLIDTMPATASVSVGTVGDRRVFAGASHELAGGDHLLAASEIYRIDGPWDNPDRFTKVNAALRYRHGTAADGFSLTGLFYRARWNATTDQPTRAIDSGLIGRFGSLDPSDGGRSRRYSLSATYAANPGDWRLRGNAYAVRQRLTLWNDFTHDLEDPVNGDQHEQNDRRTFAGASLTAARDITIGGIGNTVTLGADGRYDDIRVDLRHTRQRALLETLTSDHVREASIGGYAEIASRWTPWLRTVLGAREDYFHVDDRNLVGGLAGTEHAALFQPKASLILGPWAKTELYASAGRGFHSNDGRAGLVEDAAGAVSLQRPLLLARSTGAEIGARSTLIPHLQAALTLFQIDFDSELTYDADVGQTSAGRPSRRRGVELTAQYRPARWIEFNTNIAFSHARYRDDDPEGRYIDDAPGFIGSAGVLIDNLGRWFGAAQYRDLGAHPLIADNSVRSPGYREINLNIGYKLTPRLSVRVDIFNVTDSTDDAANYLYVTRLPGEPAQGLEDIQIHPLEPRSFRLTFTARL